MEDWFWEGVAAYVRDIPYTILNTNSDWRRGWLYAAKADTRNFMTEYEEGRSGYGYLTDEPTIEWLLGRLDWAISRIEKLEKEVAWHNQNSDYNKIIAY